MGLFQALLIALLCATSSRALLKQILGAAILGDIVPAFYPSNCGSTRTNFTTFLLYSRNHPDDPMLLRPNDWKALQKSGFDPSIPTKVIIHGFLDSLKLSDWMMRMKNSLLKHAEFNVIVTDWSCGNGLPYSKAVENSRDAAAQLGDLILFLKDARGAQFKDFHLIGHSLGSHISGIVGHRLKKLGRISALDPAGPKFYNTSLDGKVDPLDAEFVDVIHTDGGNSLFEGLGLYYQVGHVDFYPNGGRTQPGCHYSPFSTVPRFGLLRATRYHLTCDHYRSIDYYIESIDSPKKRAVESNCLYVGVQCRDWKSFSQGRCADCTVPGNCAPMGYFSNIYPYRNSKDKTREFYVKTSDKEPYCVHQYQVVLETDEEESSQRSAQSFELGTKIIHLNVKTGSGKVSRMKLSETGLPRTKKQVYLATAKFPLGEVHTADLWWDDEDWTASFGEPSSYGFKMKKLEIVPIQMQSLEAKARSLETSSKKITLCAEEQKLLTRDYRMKLTAC